MSEEIGLYYAGEAVTAAEELNVTRKSSEYCDCFKINDRKFKKLFRLDKQSADFFN